MNIDDVPADTIEAPNASQCWAGMFAKQHELMLKYEPIERKNGLMVPEAPYNLDDIRVQLRIKDFFWRVTEELAEAIENPIQLGKDEWKRRWADEPEIRHFFEELADAVHFLIEASILSNYPADLVNKQWEGVVRDLVNEVPPPANFGQVIYHMALIVRNLGLAANTLKNKPWKQTQMPTDESRFFHEFTQAWYHLIILFVGYGLDREDIFILYMRKNAVNHFRQRSNY